MRKSDNICTFAISLSGVQPYFNRQRSVLLSFIAENVGNFHEDERVSKRFSRYMAWAAFTSSSSGFLRPSAIDMWRSQSTFLFYKYLVDRTVRPPFSIMTMKNFLLLLALLLASPAWSQSKLVFVLGPDVCPPVKVICGGSTYTVYDHLEIDRPSSTIYVTAYDCAGKKLTYDHGSKSGSRGGKHYSISTYTFRNVQDFSQPPTAPDGNNPGSSNVARPSSPSGGLATNTANAVATSITSLGGSDRPSLQA